MLEWGLNASEEVAGYTSFNCSIIRMCQYRLVRHWTEVVARESRGLYILSHQPWFDSQSMLVGFVVDKFACGKFPLVYLPSSVFEHHCQYYAHQLALEKTVELRLFTYSSRSPLVLFLNSDFSLLYWI
jgi:hypothetical protein